MIPAIVFFGILGLGLFFIGTKKGWWTPTTPNFTWPPWATKLLLAILVIWVVCFFWGPISATVCGWFDSKSDSAGKNTDKNGLVRLQPGEYVLVYLRPGKSTTRLEKGCVDYFLGYKPMGKDCPGENNPETSPWDTWPNGKYTVINNNTREVVYGWEQ